MAASGTTNLSKVLEQEDVEDAPGDSADPFRYRPKLHTTTLNVES